MKGWVKWLIIGLAVVFFLIFFGTMALSLAAYLFDFLSLLLGWIATAARWLAKVVDIFGIFTASANYEVLSCAADSVLKITKGVI